jgi:hypothetical protein
LTQNLQEPAKQQDSTRAMKVWAQLAELFGQAFFRENGDTPSVLWQQAVWKFTNKQIATGLANLANDGLSFPPNLSLFVEACKRPPKLGADKTGYWDTPKLEDKRESGHMPFAEWKKLNGVET